MRRLLHELRHLSGRRRHAIRDAFELAMARLRYRGKSWILGSPGE
jgi:hypothetical protein